MRIKHPHSSWRPWHLVGSNPSLVIGLALFVLPFLLFFRETLGLQVFYVHDIQYYFFPYRKVAADIVQSGHLPLWNPYTNGGMPLLGDGQTALLYPPNWLIFFLPTAHALTLAIVSTFSIAGVGMFLYVRQLHFARGIAMISALSFMFCGFLVGHLVHVSIPATAALVPWIFWGFERLIQSPSPGNLVLAALTVALQCTAGHPQVPIYCGVAIGFYAVVIALMQLFASRRAGASLAPLGLLAAMYVGGGLLAAIQLVPWAELSRLSPRAAKTSYELFESFSLARADWLLLLFPYGYGGLRTSWMQSLPDVDFGLIVYMWERLPYVGLLPLALALLGLIDARRRFRGEQDQSAETILMRGRLVALGVVLLVMLLIAAGGSTPLGHVVYNIPLLGNLRGQARATAIVAFAISALAAFGLHRLSDRRDRVDWIAIGAAAVLLLAIGVALIVAPSIKPDAPQMTPAQFFAQTLRLSNRNASVPLIFGLLSAMALAWAALGRFRPATLVALGAIVAIELCGFAVTFNPTIDPAVFSNVPPSVKALRNDTQPWRVAVFIGTDRLPPDIAQDQLAVSWAMVYHLEDINGFNSLQPKRLVDFLYWGQREDVTYGGLPAELLADPFNRTLTLLGVRYVAIQKRFRWRNLPRRWLAAYQDENLWIIRNTDEAGRAYFATLVLVGNDAPRVLATVHDPNFDPNAYAVLETASVSDAEAQALCDSTGGNTASASKPYVEMSAISPNELRLRTITSAQRLLVVRDMFFPGWVAQLKQDDGSWKDVTIHRTNYLFRGVVVPAGTHELRMIYRPASVRVGAVVSLVTATMMLTAVFVAGWRRRHRLGRLSSG